MKVLTKVISVKDGGSDFFFWLQITENAEQRTSREPLDKASRIIST